MCPHVVLSFTEITQDKLWEGGGKGCGAQKGSKPFSCTKAFLQAGQQNLAEDSFKSRS